MGLTLRVLCVHKAGQRSLGHDLISTPHRVLPRSEALKQELTFGSGQSSAVFFAFSLPKKTLASKAKPNEQINRPIFASQRIRRVRI
jgi:hypothetical protein